MSNHNDLFSHINILGVNVNAITMDMAIQAIEQWIERRESNYVCVTNVHGVIDSWRDEKIRRIYNSAGLVTPDGMPLVWLSRIRGFRSIERVYGPDLMLALCKLSVQKGYRHFLYGGGPGVPERLAENLKRRFPGMEVVGINSPPFRPLTPEEDDEIVKMINDSDPDLLWVGLGGTKQDQWMEAHINKLTAPVLIGVGAAFDFISGTKKQAPYWMQRTGLEWLFRLISEPKRLGPRYLIDNPLFLWLVLLQILGIKGYKTS